MARWWVLGCVLATGAVAWGEDQCAADGGAGFCENPSGTTMPGEAASYRIARRCTGVDGVCFDPVATPGDADGGPPPDPRPTAADDGAGGCHAGWGDGGAALALIALALLLARSRRR